MFAYKCRTVNFGINCKSVPMSFKYLMYNSYAICTFYCDIYVKKIRVVITPSDQVQLEGK